MIIITALNCLTNSPFTPTLAFGSIGGNEGMCLANVEAGVGRSLTWLNKGVRRVTLWTTSSRAREWPKTHLGNSASKGDEQRPRLAVEISHELVERVVPDARKGQP